MSTQSHKGQVLPLKNRVIPVDNNTSFLAHYDLNERDVLTGIAPIGYRYALQLNGSSAYMRVSNPIQNASIFTISFWIKHNTPASWSDILTFDTGVDGTACRIEKDDVASQYRWYIDGCFPTGNIIFTHDGAQWDHIALVSDGTNVYCYKNGVQTYTAVKVASNLPGCSYINIGRRLTGGNWYGSVSDLRFWQTAKSQNQIQTEMNKELAGSEPGLAGYWKLNEGFGATTYDGCKGNDGVVYSGTWTDGRAIFTLRSDGYYGGGIAVEEGTTNIFTGEVTNSPFSSVVTNDEWDKITKTATGFSRRYMVTLGSLVNGATYTASATVYNPMNTDITLEYDWCDVTAITTTIKAKETKKIYTTASRATYDATYRFFDFEIMSAVNDIVWTKDVQIEQKSFATSFVNGSRPNPDLRYNASLIQGQAQGTIAFWYKPHNLLSGYQVLIRSGDWATAKHGWGIMKQSGSNQVYFEYGIPGTNTLSAMSVGAVLAVNQWIFIAVTWSSSGVALFTSDASGGLNKVGTSGAPPILTAYDYPITLGRNSATYELIGSAVYDELRIDKVARTDDEILAWFYSNSPFYPKGIYRVGY